MIQITNGFVVMIKNDFEVLRMEKDILDFDIDYFRDKVIFIRDTTRLWITESEKLKSMGMKNIINENIDYAMAVLNQIYKGFLAYSEVAKKHGEQRNEFNADFTKKLQEFPSKADDYIEKGGSPEFILNEMDNYKNYTLPVVELINMLGEINLAMITTAFELSFRLCVSVFEEDGANFISTFKKLMPYLAGKFIPLFEEIKLAVEIGEMFEPYAKRSENIASADGVLAKLEFKTTELALCLSIMSSLSERLSKIETVKIFC